MLNLIISSVIAGILGTVFGAVIGIVFGKKGDKFTSLLMCFAGGIMLAIVCFDLIPEALDLSREAFGNKNLFFSLLSVICAIGIGVFFILILSNLAEKKNLFVENSNSTDIRSRKLIQSGIVMTLAIALHNFPEGMAIGASQTISVEKGILMAIFLAIHNIPEGMAIVAPLRIGGLRKSKVVAIAALTGIPTVFGAILGYVIGSGNLFLNSWCVAIAGGAMLYIIFNDMLREAMEVDKSKRPAIVIIVSIVIGIILVNVL